MRIPIHHALARLLTATTAHVRRTVRLAALLSLLMLIAPPALASKTVTLIVTDAQGTVVAEMTPQATGQVQVTYEAAYRPYGQQALGVPQAGPGYTGHVNDPDSGLVYMQARYYDPMTGRFPSVDPVGPTPGNIFNFNRYAYANNNPIVNTDPTGKDTVVQLQSYIIGSAPIQGDYGHQYVYLRDTDTGETIISRAGPSAKYPGGASAVVSRSPVKDPGGHGNVTLVTEMGPASKSTDSANGVPLGKPVAGSTTTLKEPIGAAKVTLGRFNKAVDAAKINYKPLSTNSNAYANTAYQVLTGATPPNSSTLPGSDVNLKSEIPACTSQDVCGGHNEK